MTPIDSQQIAGGLLRLLAATLVLTYKTRHLCWRAHGTAWGPRLRSVIVCDHHMLNAAADALGRRIVALGVSVPTSLEGLTQMSSVRADATLQPEGAAMLRLAQDHQRVVQNIETLQAMLPLAPGSPDPALLAALAEGHGRCAARILGASAPATASRP